MSEKREMGLKLQVGYTFPLSRRPWHESPESIHTPSITLTKHNQLLPVVKHDLPVFHIAQLGMLPAQKEIPGTSRPFM